MLKSIFFLFFIVYWIVEGFLEVISERVVLEYIVCVERYLDEY